MIVALDFDGVMHPVNSRTEPKFCRLDLFEAWLRARLKVRLIISSSWREVHPLDELTSFFSDDLQSRVVGMTPVYEKLFGKPWVRSSADIAATKYQRQVEIERWIVASGAPGASWAAIDDDPSLFEPSCGRLVLCDPKVGLTQADLVRLDAMILGAAA